jgi:hypothetical protein
VITIVFRQIRRTGTLRGYICNCWSVQYDTSQCEMKVKFTVPRRGAALEIHGVVEAHTGPPRAVDEMGGALARTSSDSPQRQGGRCTFDSLIIPLKQSALGLEMNWKDYL